MMLAAMGSSLTARGVWLTAVASALSRRWGRGVGAHNFGRSGATSRDGLRVAADVAQLTPDIVLVEYSINDADIVSGLTLSESRENMIDIVETLRRRREDVRLCLMTMNPALGLRGLLRPALSAYYSLYRPLAEEVGVECIDIYAAWRRLQQTELERSLPDGLHPSAAAELALVAPSIIAHLEGAR